MKICAGDFDFFHQNSSIAKIGVYKISICNKIFCNNSGENAPGEKIGKPWSDQLVKIIIITIRT